MSRRILLLTAGIALLTMSCGVLSMLPGGEADSAEEFAAGLPGFELDEDQVIESIEGGETFTLFDLINEDDQGEMFEPGVQRYTVDMKSDVLIDLSTGWCARNTEVMEDNETHISGTITVDDYTIPDDQLVAFHYEVPAGELDAAPDGLACYSWDIVATQWPVGKHRVVESWTLESDLSDGYDDYGAGTYSIEYTITVTD